MKNLLWREFHWNRVVVIQAVVVFLLPYAILLIIGLWPRDASLSWKDVRVGMGGAAVYSLVISQITIAFLGGNAFAGERSDRTAEFLAFLPISRNQRLFSKLLFASIVAALIWGINGIVFGILGGFDDLLDGDWTLIARYIASTGLVMFGVGWLISSIQSSSPFAVFGGIAVPMLTMIGLWLTIVFGVEGSGEYFAKWYTLISVSLGAIGFALGTWLFLGRVEP